MTRRNFEHLSGPTRYTEIDGGHWATGAAFVEEYTTLIDNDLKE